MSARRIPPTRGELGHASWEALGSSVVLRVADPTPGVLARAQAAVRRELDSIDRACSRFRPDSELVQMNAFSGRPVQVSALLMETIELAMRAAELTDGAVDPTVGRALELAGYDRDWRLLCPPRAPAAEVGEPTGSPEVMAWRRSGWQTVSVDSRAGTVCLPKGVRLDLGATAKAWAADRAAHLAAADAGCGVLVSLGGDVAISGEAPRGGWRIRVTDDHRSGPDAPGQTISIRGGGLATSSVAARRWRHEERDMHHIIDPRTWEPARSAWRTASVAAASCADANIASTAAIVRGTPAASWLAELGLPARLVDREGRELAICGWPAEP